MRTVKIGQTGLTKKSPSPALKEAGQFGSYNLKRFERSHGSNCTAGTVQGQSGRSGARLALRLRAHLTGYAQKKKGVFETLTWGKEGCIEAGLAARIRLITGTEQGKTG